MPEIYVGEVIHYFPNVKVAVVTLIDRLNVGDTVRVKSPDKKKRGNKVDFGQKIDSMEIEHKPITTAEPGWMVAIRVTQQLYSGDRVYKKAG